MCVVLGRCVYRQFVIFVVVVVCAHIGNWRCTSFVDFYKLCCNTHITMLERLEFSNMRVVYIVMQLVDDGSIFYDAAMLFCIVCCVCCFFAFASSPSSILH